MVTSNLPVYFKSKIRAIAMIAATSALLVGGVGIVAYDRFAERQEMRSELTALTEILSAPAAAALSVDDASRAAELLASLRAKRQVVRAQIFSAQGRTFASYLRTLGSASAPVLRPDGAWFENGRLLLFHSIDSKGAKIGTFYLEADLADLNGRLWRFSVAVAGSGLLGWLIALVLATSSAKRADDEVGQFREQLDGTPAERERSEAESQRERTELDPEVVMRLNELVESNADLKKAKELAEASCRAESELQADTSHEIRTLLNAVAGMTDMLLDTDLSRLQRDYAEAAKFSADLMMAVVNNTLDLAKLEAGRLELEAVPFNVRNLVEESTKALAMRAQRKGLELMGSTRPDVPELAVGDVNRLRQTLINLLGNALKFTDQGEVAVEVRRASERTTRQSLHFVVRDTGIGIAAEKQQTILQAFKQAGESNHRKFEGLGLGLVIAARLVKAMGGNIWLKSELGQGSEFHFTVPVDIVQEPEKTAVGNDSLAGISVLIVDDNPAYSRILEDLLQSWGMKTEAVGSALQALAVLQVRTARQTPFQAMVTDLKMPEMDGLALVERIRTRAVNAQHMAVLMLTSGEPAGFSAQASALGIAACLAKPVGRAELRAALSLALTQGRLLDAVVSSTAPVAPAVRHKTEQAPAGPGPIGQSLHVLLAEDDDVNVMVACGILEKGGHRVEVAHNGEEVLSKLAVGSFDVVLMDIQMPGMDGFEATAAIREKEKGSGAHIPIIAMTAHALGGYKERCFEAGMDGYVSKPIRYNVLFEALAQSQRAKISVQEPPPTPVNLEVGSDAG